MSGARGAGRPALGVLGGLAAAVLWLKIASMLVLAAVAMGAWNVANYPEAEGAARGLLIANAVEPHKAYFNLGSALAADGDLAGARRELGTALRLANGADECPIRQNLALVLEALGAGSAERQEADAAAALIAEAQRVVGGADEGCRTRSLADLATRLAGAEASAAGRGEEAGQGAAMPDESGTPAEVPLPAAAKAGLDEIMGRMVAGQGRQQAEDDPRGSPAKSRVDRPW